MSVDIGPKIGIDGEAEFRKELGNINQQLRTLGSEMKAVTSAFAGNEKSQEALSAQAGVLTRQIEAQEQKLSRLEKGLASAAQKYGENDTKTLRWAQAVQDATADLNKMRAQLTRVEGELDDTADAADELADSMDDAGSKSSGFGDTLKSAFLGGGISGAIQSLIGGVKDLVENTSEYRKIMASLEVSSQRAGYSAEETAATYRTLYGVLGDDQTAATTTANLQAIGLAQEQLEQITSATIGAWATYGDSIPIDSLSEAINETIQEGKVTGTFADALNWAGISEDAFNEKLSAAATPAERANLVLQQLASQGLVQAGQAWQQNNADIVANNQATAELTETMAGFGAVLSPVVASAKQGLAELLGGVLSVVQAFQEDGLGGAVQQAGTLVGQFVGNLKERAPQMLAASQEMMGQLWQGVVDNIPQVIEGFSQTVSGVLNFLSEHLPDMIQKGGDMLGSLVQGIVEGIPVMLQNLPRIITSFVNFIVQNLPAIVDAGFELLGGLITGIVKAIPELVAALPQIIVAIVDGLGALLGSIVEVGTNIVEGIWEGIKGAAGWLLNRVKEWCGSILDGIMGFFGIHSPSTVFRDQVGRYMAQGIGVGFEEEMSSVAARMQRSIPTPTVETIQNAAAGMVNGLSAASAGQACPSTIVLQLNNGMEIARWQLPYLRQAGRANPEVVSGV